MPLLHVKIIIPKYPEERPFFNDEDINTLLSTYMDYANASHKEISEWYHNKNTGKL